LIHHTINLLMQNNLIASFIIGGLVIGGGSFYGGMQYQKSQPPTGARGQFQAGQGNGPGRGFAAGGVGGRNGAGGPGAGAGFTAGEVVSKDSTSITLKLRDGGSKIILTSSSTKVGKMTDGSLDDLKAGTEVTVTGATNSDGSVSASMIQLRPAGMPGMGTGARLQGQVVPPAAQ
jgi:hypothetical protein